jgi:hypothetical protein
MADQAAVVARGPVGSRIQALSEPGISSLAKARAVSALYLSIASLKIAGKQRLYMELQRCGSVRPVDVDDPSSVSAELVSLADSIVENSDAKSAVQQIEALISQIESIQASQIRVAER